MHTPTTIRGHSHSHSQSSHTPTTNTNFENYNLFSPTIHSHSMQDNINDTNNNNNNSNNNNNNNNNKKVLRTMKRHKRFGHRLATTTTNIQQTPQQLHNSQQNVTPSQKQQLPTPLIPKIIRSKPSLSDNQ